MKEEITIGFIGNPNCGKTTLFNAYTGANLKVANWPGVTVEKKEGVMRYHDHVYKLVDLPGTYSLTSYTMEEMVARQYILSGQVDVLLNVVDASSLERNLYLTLQLIELGKPVVLALNMMDVVEERGMEIDLHRLPEMLGIPVIPVSARKKKGLDILIHAAAHHKDIPGQSPLIHHHTSRGLHEKHVMVYHDDLEAKIDEVIASLEKEYPDMVNYRWHAVKLLEADEEIGKKYPLKKGAIDRSYEGEIINQKYDFIEEVIREVVVNKTEREALTDKVDRLLTNSILGLPIFLAVMSLIFFLTFTIGDWFKGYFEGGIEYMGVKTALLLESMKVNEMLASLMVDGIIAGVGGILTFLPNIFVLFLCLAVLEDSGYMSRVAYVMDGLMGRLGLSGKAFIPMILGFGCTVPAIMASRALESVKDRRKVMLITPFMSCSAKLPIYVLFAEMFFREKAFMAACSMYLLGFMVAILTAFVIHLLEKGRGENPDSLLIELPEYKSPSVRTIFIYVWQKIQDYLTRAGTTIFIASIIMWVLLNFGAGGYTANMGESFGAILGKALVPFLRPIGLGYWQIAVALIAGVSAKEVVVSSCAVLFSIPNLSSAGTETMAGVLAGMGFGSPNAWAMMVFCLLYVPCVAALATIKREAGSWRWLGFTVLFQIGVAWVAALLVYRIGALLT